MRGPKLIIFDCDGVLVDSEHISSRLFAALISERGVAVTPAEVFGMLAGRTMAQCHEIIAGLFGGVMPAGLIEAYRQRVTHALHHEITPIPGIDSVLTWLDARAQRYCVASNGAHATMRTTLGATGLLPRFEGRLFSAADVPRGKPAPDVFLLAAGTFGVPPAQCAVIEDTPTGICAGVAAGMTVYGYCAASSAEALRRAGAHHVFDDMRALPALLAAALAEPLGV